MFVANLKENLAKAWLHFVSHLPHDFPEKHEHMTSGQVWKTVVRLNCSDQRANVSP
jgi:hypothetical protein